MIIVDEEHTPFIGYFLKDIDEHENYRKVADNLRSEHSVLRVLTNVAIDYSLLV